MLQEGNKQVILVPGVGFGGAEMFFLSHRLRRLGYRTLTFWHWPWSDDLGTKATKLRELVSSQTEADVIHLVGHSLGGQIILRMCSASLPAHLGRIVTMGTPHLGSAAARRVRKFLLVRWLLSRALNEACSEGPIPVRGDCELGTIAGKLNLVLGVFLGVGNPNDTIVAEEEAKHPDAMDHVLLMASHGSMLTSPRVARHIACFLATGTFRIASSQHQNERPTCCPI